LKQASSVYTGDACRFTPCDNSAVCRNSFSWLDERRAESTAAWRFNHHPVASLGVQHKSPTQHLNRAIFMHHTLHPCGPSEPTQAPWRHCFATPRQQTHLQWGETFKHANHTIAAAMCAVATGTKSTLQLPKPNRKAAFENFRVGQSGIGHVTLHAMGAIEVWPGPGTSTHCFVVLQCVIAKGYVVHAALTCTLHAKGTE
jgi:hypothetical protein